MHNNDVNSMYFIKINVKDQPRDYFNEEYSSFILLPKLRTSLNSCSKRILYSEWISNYKLGFLLGNFVRRPAATRQLLTSVRLKE